MKQNQVKLILFFLSLSLLAVSQKTEKSVFYTTAGRNNQWITFQDNHRALYRVITNEAFRQLDERAARVSKFSSKAAWTNHQAEVKAVLCESLDKFAKTPLNARTTGKLERETFTVEKVIFESHPGFYVTAGLFLPKKRQNPAPAVIYSCGHTELGFRSDTYQQVILNLVNKGFIVLAFDPLGQGERLQYPDPQSGKSKTGGPTAEHSYAGIQTLLTGISISDYFIWDGIRVIDYLETRPEVDIKRIGITGRSGGGTQTALIAACDDRVYAAAPENYITNFKRLLQSIGPQDAEQNPYKAIAKGFDHPDFLHIRAPRPTLMITTTHDFFSIQGARETYAEALKSYTALGKPENLSMVEDFGNHQSTKSNRESLYAFFQKHLNMPGDPTDLPTTPFTLKELQVTPTGQIGTSYDCQTVFDLNQKYFPGKTVPENNFSNTVQQTSGVNFNRDIVSSVYSGKFLEKDIVVEKYFLENDRNDFALPVYVLNKENTSPKNLVVWIHPEGKERILSEPLLEDILEQGYSVISADLPGTGELHDPEFSGDGVIQKVPFNYTFGANLAGKSIQAIQAEAIDLLMQHIEKDNRYQKLSKTALAQGLAASSFLVYAVLNKKFEKVAFINFPEPVKNLIEEEYYDPKKAFSAEPGSLLHYDLSDLVNNLSESGTEIYLQKKENVQTSDEKKGHSGLIDFLKK